MNIITLYRGIRRSAWIGSGLVVAGGFLIGCGQSNQTPAILGIRISPNPVRAGEKSEITLSIAYPCAGTSYSWTASDGSFNPAEANVPSTTFIAPIRPTPVRISVELKLQGQTVSTKEEIVQVVAPDDESKHNGQPADEQDSSTLISITKVPRDDPNGGPNSEDDISGMVKVNVLSGSPSGYALVIYAKTDDWWVQPQAKYPLTTINANGSFHETIHTGSEYAVFLVKTSFQPLPRVPVLPPHGGDIIEIARLKGRKVP